MPMRKPVPSTSAAFRLFLLFVAGIFVISIAPFLGSVLWAMAAAIIFEPLQRWLRGHAGLPARLASALTVAIIALAIVTPTLVLAGIATDQAIGLADRAQRGELDVDRSLDRALHALPAWAQGLLRSSGIEDGHDAAIRLKTAIGSSGALLTSGVVGVGKTLASFALGLFVTLYLTYFFLLGGPTLRRRAAWLIPMRADEQAMLGERFAAVVRATVMGTIVIGIAQGTTGGIVMALIGVPNAALLGVLMAFASLVPVAGTGLVWVPVSLYLFLAGEPGRGLTMAIMGLFFIGSVDTVLRPILVRRASRVPDGLVLVTTLGGRACSG